MVALIEKLARDGGATREAARKETAKPKPGRPKAFVFSYRAPTKTFNLRLQFTKATSTATKSSPRSKGSSGSCERRSSFARRCEGMGNGGWASPSCRHLAPDPAAGYQLELPTLPTARNSAE